ncbi:MAG TPA: hypothetical protein VFB14_24105 [Bryobacteraceae bacterium]|nr:hypothetical protein [Bryobacteraceae bacterium]
MRSEYHDDDEVLEALRSLTDADLTRLENFARLRLERYGARCGDTDPADLVQDAVVRTCYGQRRWRRGVSILNHLASVISSQASNRLHQASRQVELTDTHSAPTSEPEAALDAAAEVERLNQRLDPLARAVMQSVRYGYTPAEAKARLNITDDVYWAARKRIRREADRGLLEEPGVTHG